MSHFTETTEELEAYINSYTRPPTDMMGQVYYRDAVKELKRRRLEATQQSATTGTPDVAATTNEGTPSE